jgi:hydrogenase maturation protease
MEPKQVQVLIIGYGNTLRCDDGIGQIVAMEVETWNLSEVSCLYRHQLTPELAEQIAEFTAVIFIDASIEAQQVTLTPIPEQPSSKNWTHHLTPASIIYLTEFLYQTKPQAWLIQIPIEDLNFGEQISNLAEQGKQEALAIVKNIINKILVKEEIQSCTK